MPFGPGRRSGERYPHGGKEFVGQAEELGAVPSVEQIGREHVVQLLEEVGIVAV